MNLISEDSCDEIQIGRKMARFGFKSKLKRKIEIL